MGLMPADLPVSSHRCSSSALAISELTSAELTRPAFSPSPEKASSKTLLRTGAFCVLSGRLSTQGT
jgi:hypothetical protein